MKNFIYAFFSLLGFFSAVAFVGSQGALCIIAPEHWAVSFVSFIGLVAAGWYFFRR